MNNKKTFYYYAHTIDWMLRVLSDEFSSSNVHVELLRMFSRRISRPAFKIKFIGQLFLRVITAIENIMQKKPGFSCYVAYIAEK